MNLKNNEIKYYFHLLFLLYILNDFGASACNQISDTPVNVSPGETPSAVGDDLLQFPVGLLTDPDELALIEGLDEPMERLKLRDQDTNMILDMLQLITGRYIFASPEFTCC